VKDSNIGLLMKETSAVGDMLRQQLKMTRRHLPSDGYVVSPKVATHADSVQQSLKVAAKLLLAFHEISKNSTQICSASEGKAFYFTSQNCIQHPEILQVWV
jgi:hypothetical protein